MSPSASPPRLWILWLLVASGGVAFAGLLMVVAPALTRAGFSWLVYGDTTLLDSFGAEPVRYLSLSHAVLGSIMVGWGASLFMITRMLARGERSAWPLLVISLAAWFIPDTAYSLISGYWQNAVLNVTAATLFAIPLSALRRHIA